MPVSEAAAFSHATPTGLCHQGGRMSKTTTRTFRAKFRGSDHLPLMLLGALKTSQALARRKAA
jgi:hypothetical protein